ncbi:hypothetical protein TWF506_007267 [Arthrobotrys conoides]|uniref:FHA domain-containing protein n=1 Tax=Arthrobotrys conoides TaxID=74498 RepID=A0AAN8RXW4_9PEZI
MASMPLENIAEVILTPTGDIPDSVGTRTIPISRKEPLITVGRSSRNKTKNLQPGHDNAYFDSPVMSRLHSWIKCDEGGKVLISDAGSMHGTYLDDKLLEPKLFVPLETGSQVRFGNSVTRGSDIFPPKAFDVKVVQNSRMAEIQHGYGITSDELILPDSPYYSSEEEDDEEDEVMITRVNPINTVDLTSGSDRGSDWEVEIAQIRVPGHWNESEWSEKPKAKAWTGSSWSDEPPSEQPITIIRETLREHTCIDLDSAPIIRDTHTVDLTAETPAPQQNKLPGARISIPDLLAQERQEQPRRLSQTPIRNGSASGDEDAMSSVGGASDTQSVEDYDEDSMDEDCTSDPEVTPESVPTSPYSPESTKAPSSTLPALSSMQSAMTVNEIVPPEVQKAWTSTWTAAPYLSPFVYADGTPSASDTMEQVRKAEAIRDRAQEFLRSRIEMQSSRSLQTPKELDTNSSAPNISTNEDTAKPNPAIPFWVRNFGQGTNVESNEGADVENRLTETLLTLKRRADVPECVSTRSETRSPSPVLKMAGNFHVSDDENDDEEDEEDGEDGEEQQHQRKETRSFDSESLSSGGDEEGYLSPEYSIDDKSESDEDEDEEDDDDLLMGYLEDDDDEEDEDEDEDLNEIIMEFCGDEDSDTESDPSDDEMAEGPTKGIETTTVQNAVKSAMSMENFFSPKDEEEVRSSHEDEIVKRWNAEIDDLFGAQPDLEIEEPKDAADIPMIDPDADLLPPASKKRKRSESEEIEECPHYAVASELEALEISTPRKIAPLPQRFLVRDNQNPGSTETQSPREEAERKEAERKELLALASELRNELEAAEPEAKRPRVQNAGATWGSTIATAMAGALIGGVGVFAALVATAGDM